MYRLDRWIQQGATWSPADLDGATLDALETLWAERDRVEREQLKKGGKGGRDREEY